jgi:hypothetical protein
MRREGRDVQCVKITAELGHGRLAGIDVLASPCPRDHHRSQHACDLSARVADARQGHVKNRPDLRRQEPDGLGGKRVASSAEAHHGHWFAELGQLQVPAMCELPEVADLAERQRSLRQLRFEVDGPDTADGAVQRSARALNASYASLLDAAIELQVPVHKKWQLGDDGGHRLHMLARAGSAWR